MKDRFKMRSNTAHIKTNKTFVINFQGNQEYLLQEVQHCCTNKKQKEKKKKKKALFGVLTNYYDSIEKTGIWEKKTFLEFGDIFFWVMTRALWK